MNIQNDKTDQAFRNKLQNIEVTPPPAVWDRLNETLGQRKKRAIGWWWTIAAASVVLAFVAGWYIAGSNSYEDDFYAELSAYKQQQIQQIYIQPKIEQHFVVELPAPDIKQFHAVLLAENKQENNTRHADNSDLSIIDSMKSHETILVAYSNNCLVTDVPPKNLNEADYAVIKSNLLALNSSNTENESNKWALGLQGSPIVNFDTPQTNKNFNNSEMITASNDVSTSYDMSMVGGMAVSFKASNKLKIISGVNYNEVAQQSGNMGVSFAGQNWLNDRFGANLDYMDQPTYSPETTVDPNNVMINTQTGLANVNMPQGVQLNQVSKTNTYNAELIENYDFKQLAGYVEVPLLMHYQLVEKQVGLYLLGGLNTNFLVANNVQLMNKREVIATGFTEGLRNITFSSSLGFGMNYMLSKRFVLNIEPTMKLYLNTLNSMSVYHTKPYTLGVFSGITYQF